MQQIQKRKKTIGPLTVSNINLPQKKAVCTIELLRFVKKYQRFYKKQVKYHVHIPQQFSDSLQLNQKVIIKQCRRISKIKSHVIDSIL